MFFKKLIFFVIFFVPAFAFSQSKQDTTSRMVRVVDSTQTTLDTIAPTPLSTIMSETSPSRKGFEMTKSPTKAVLLSLGFPGLGQWYVGDKWKTPVFAAAWGTIGFLIVRNHINYTDKETEYQAALQADNANLALLLKRQREVYHDNRDQAAFALLGVYIISMVDAYVGAHLYDFNVDDDLSFGFKSASDGTTMLNCAIRF